jgi:uncharacterized RDD family membrane protein YckC
VSVPPGWYKDPADPSVQRWWDGEGWVGDPLPADATPPPGPPESATTAAGVGQRGGQPAAGGRLGHAIPPAGSARRPDPTTTPPPGRAPAHPPHPYTGYPYTGTTPPQPHGLPLATPGARLLARLVDGLLLLGLNVVVNGWFVYRLWLEIEPTVTEIWRRAAVGDTSTEGIPLLGERVPDLLLTILVIATALWFAYEVPAVANTGQTPGKRLLRIKVMRMESTEPLSFGRSFRRWNTMGFPTLLWYCFGVGLVLQLIDVLFVPFDRPLHQALHDKSAQTVVVAVPATAPPPPTTHEEANR